MAKHYKHALLLFTKPPLPGLVKTRLTKEKGGIFSPEQAALFFHNSLFDVTELCCEAMRQLEEEDSKARAVDPNLDTHEYDFFFSTTPAANVAVLEQLYRDSGTWPRPFTFLEDEGATFDDHFDNAFQQIFARGYDSVLSVGGDIPMLPLSHVKRAFRYLQKLLRESPEKGGLVQAPCQECGVSVIGWTKDTPMDHQGVYYNNNGRPALQAYVDKCEPEQIPLYSMEPVADIDDGQDLAHAITLARSAAYGHGFQPDFYVPKRFLGWIDAMGLRVSTPPNEDRDSREGIDK
ncbi:MAG: DUF2064 domain-containing protein [Coriobacteriales bacterium]|jgi:glycosyltransferase A (GT-A) superfamily protein (DUF2064 family)|nr:DUF2064 domain-containing protein [Coriobacteriales bacterium]